MASGGEQNLYVRESSVRKIKKFGIFYHFESRRGPLNCLLETPAMNQASVCCVHKQMTDSFDMENLSVNE